MLKIESLNGKPYEMNAYDEEGRRVGHAGRRSDGWRLLTSRGWTSAIPFEQAKKILEALVQ